MRVFDAAPVEVSMRALSTGGRTRLFDSVNLSRLLAQLTDAFASAEESEGKVRLNVTGKVGIQDAKKKKIFRFMRTCRGKQAEPRERALVVFIDTACRPRFAGQ